MATRPSSEPRYPAVPIEIFRERIEENQLDEKPYRPWASKRVSATDLSPFSPFRSLLPDLKYDVKSRKIDPVNGTIPLTEVISSALLCYRLICRYLLLKPEGNAAVQDDRSNASTTTSVWQMKLVYRTNRYSRFGSMDNEGLPDTDPNCHILFMDDHGLFDIRADGNAVEVMDHIVTLVNSLCSDNCAHSYDDLVAGCVA